jgi:hypothetical protein
MAFGSGTIIEINPGSGSTGGGAFDPGTFAAMSTNLTATSANTASPTVSSASYTFVTADIGHYLFIATGVNWYAGWYRITNVSAGAATINAAIGQVAGYSSASPAGPTFMNVVAGCASTANPTAGTWSIDYSRTTSPRFSYSDLNLSAGSSTIASAAQPFGVNCIGNFLNITSTVNWTASRYEITAISGANATLDRAAGTAGATSGIGYLGGAAPNPGFAAAIDSSIGTIKFVLGNNTYSMSATQNVSGGSVAESAAASWIGYNTNRVRGNADVPAPVFQPGANTMTLLGFTGTGWVSNIFFDNLSTAHTGVTAVTGGAGINLRALKSRNNGTAFTLTSNAYVENCHVTGGGAAFYCSAGGNFLIGCSVRNFSGTVAFNSVSTTGPNFAERCIVHTATTASLKAFNIERTAHCIAYGLTGSGSIGFQISPAFACINSVVYNVPTAFLFASGAMSGVYQIVQPAYGAVSTAFSGLRGDTAVPSPIVLLADPFVDGTTNYDFTPNTTGGGGALLIGAGWPLAFPASFP